MGKATDNSADSDAFPKRFLPVTFVWAGLPPASNLFLSDSHGFPGAAALPSGVSTLRQVCTPPVLRQCQPVGRMLSTETKARTSFCGHDDGVTCSVLCPGGRRSVSGHGCVMPIWCVERPWKGWSWCVTLFGVAHDPTQPPPPQLTIAPETKPGGHLGAEGAVVQWLVRHDPP